MSRALMLAAGLAAACAGAAQAQSPCAFLCTPTFVAQPGIAVTNAIDTPEFLSSKADFNLRFTTVIPTALPRLALVALFQWTPSETVNAPGIGYGGIIKLLRTQDTGGWVDVSFDPMGVFSPAPLFNEKAYNHKLDLEGAVGLHLFKDLPASNYLHGVSVYGLVDYLASGIPTGADHWVLLSGLTLPIAPWHSSGGLAAATRSLAPWRR